MSQVEQYQWLFRRSPALLVSLNDDGFFVDASDAWLRRFPEQAINFELADFSFWRISPRDARFVAGFGRIHNLSAAQLSGAAA